MSKLTELVEQGRIVQLPEGEPRDQVAEILDRPDVEGYVPAIDAPVLLHLIKEAGWEDAQPLMAYVSTEQLVSFVDLDCWTKDSFDIKKFEPWLAALVAEAPDRAFQRHCRETDPEILAMYFKGRVEVGMVDEEGDVSPEIAAKPYEFTPDGVYAVVYPDDETEAALVRAVVRRLYELDRVLAWTLLEAARWELMSFMEEEGGRFRRSRLEELGFVEWDEAVLIYKPLDPLAFRQRLEAGELAPKLSQRPDDVELPVLAGPRDEGRFYFVRVLQQLEADEVPALMREFVSLQNRALIADGVEPGEIDRAQLPLERSTGYLSLGLEYLSRIDDDAASTILRTVPLRDVFRVGFSLCWSLRGTLVRLRRSPTLSVIEGRRFSLLGLDEAAHATALLSSRPQFSVEPGSVEVFYRQAQVDDSAVRLSLVAFKQLWCFAMAGFEPATLVQAAYAGGWVNDVDEVTFDVIFSTYVLATLMGLDEWRVGLSAEELDRVPQLLAARGWEQDPDLLRALWPTELPGPTARLARMWVDAVLARLEEELAAATDVPVEIGRQLVLVSG